jgi:hypothetical protein
MPKKENGVYPYSGILSNLKKGGNSDACQNMGELPSEISQSQKDKHCVIPVT